MRTLLLGFLLSFASSGFSQERAPLDTDPTLLLHGAVAPSGDVGPEDLSPEHYKVHGGPWREMTSDDGAQTAPDDKTGIATESTDSLNQQSVGN